MPRDLSDYRFGGFFPTPDPFWVWRSGSMSQGGREVLFEAILVHFD